MADITETDRPRPTIDALHLCLEALGDVEALLPGLRRSNRQRMLAQITRGDRVTLLLAVLAIAAWILSGGAVATLVGLFLGSVLCCAASAALIIGLGFDLVKPTEDLGRVLDLRLFELHQALSVAFPETPLDRGVPFESLRQLENQLKRMRGDVQAALEAQPAAPRLSPVRRRPR